MFTEADSLEEGGDLDGRKFFKFTKVGDCLEGTFVNRRADKDLNKNHQYLYDIDLKIGQEYINDGTPGIANEELHKFTVSGKASIDRQMILVQLGQYVQIKLAGLIKGKQPLPFKDIKVYASPDKINEEWIKEHPTAKLLENTFGVTEEVEDLPSVDYTNQ